MARRREPQVTTHTQSNSSAQFFSASDIERYGYCPLNWWQKYQGVTENGQNLEKGTQHHEKIAKDISSITERETIASRSQMSMLWFAVVAILLGVNGAAIIYFKYISHIHEVAFSSVLAVISILWIGLAITLFLFAVVRELIRKEETEGSIVDEKEKLPSEKRAGKIEEPKQIRAGIGSASSSALEPQTSGETADIVDFESTKGTILSRKNVAQWFVTIAIALALSGYMLEYPFAPPEVLSRILLAGALVWLIGTSIALFFALRVEEKIKAIDKGAKEDQYIKLHKVRTRSEILIMLFAAGAVILGIAGFFVYYKLAFEPLDLFGQIFIVLSLVWMSAGFLFFYRSLLVGVRTRIALREILSGLSLDTRKPSNLRAHVEALEKGKILTEEYSILSMAVLAIILGINSILIRIETSDIFSRILEIVALIWLIGASVFLYDVLKHQQIARSLRKHYSLDEASIEYTDSMDKESKLLESPRYHIRGRPDYIIKRKNKIIPVEVKTGRIPRGPHFSHILQLAAYCILVEDQYKQRPPYGLIRYSKEKEFKIDYDDKLKDLIISKVTEMQNCIDEGAAHRNHKRQNKCKYCSRRDNCPEKLT
ncbi:MAG: CRISPR-associated protein Cas4 [Thermoplasmata archaeon]|nr:MAG: CRISPR-associated protein Cas4 [Thermoplasmata archaeon]